MGDISTHFNRSEFACKCGCGFATVDVKLLSILEAVRVKFDSPLTINSACRCEIHNAKVGGAKGSKHKQGIAADIVVKGVSPNDVHAFLSDYLAGQHGLGKYNSFTHVDARVIPARW